MAKLASVQHTSRRYRPEPEPIGRTTAPCKQARPRSKSTTKVLRQSSLRTCCRERLGAMGDLAMNCCSQKRPQGGAESLGCTWRKSAFSVILQSC